jgi:hypothetical protein
VDGGGGGGGAGGGGVPPLSYVVLSYRLTNRQVLVMGVQTEERAAVTLGMHLLRGEPRDAVVMAVPVLRDSRDWGTPPPRLASVRHPTDAEVARELAAHPALLCQPAHLYRKLWIGVPN